MASVKKPTEFEIELSALINKHNLESGSDTSDWILANFMIDCLRAFNSAIFSKENRNGKFRPPKDKIFVNEFLKGQEWEE